MHKKFEINPTKIKGGCQSGRKGIAHNSKSDLPLSWQDWVVVMFFERKLQPGFFSLCSGFQYKKKLEKKQNELYLFLQGHFLESSFWLTKKMGGWLGIFRPGFAHS